MKKIKTLFFVLSFVLIGLMATAQNGFDQLVRSSPADATKLVQSFADPLFKGLGIGLNSGWNNTAETKKILHFDLRVSANVAMIPTSAKTFDVTQIGLSNHIQVNPTSLSNITPTFGGDKNSATPLIDIKDDNGNKIGSFNMPNGVIQYIPTPNIQLIVGIFKNTDFTIRATPTIHIGSNAGSVGMIGLGIKHDIIQDIVGKNANKLIPFNLAIALNYNRLTYSSTLNVQPDKGTQPATSNTVSDFSNQRLKGNFNGINVQAIISKKILFFTPFLSVGYQSANTTFNVLGNFPVSASSGFYATMTDPVHIKENNINNLRTDLGFQLNLFVFRIFASYSPGKYQSANAGIGFGF